MIPYVNVSMKRLVPILCFVAAGLPVNIIADANIEKWVDREGRVHYGDQPPSWAKPTPVLVRPNVIETNPPARTAKRAATSRTPDEIPSFPAPQERRDIQAYIELCRSNRGVDCEREARAMIDGPATLLFPGDPLLLPRPDLTPPASPPPPAAPERL